MRKKDRKISKKRSLVFRLLYYWTKLTCMNPLTLSDDNQLRFSYYSLVYGIVLIASYSYLCVRLTINRLNTSVPGETPLGTIVISAVLASEFFQAFQMWATFSFRQNRTKLIVKSFTKAEKTSTKLDIRIDYEKCFRKLAIYLAVVTALYFIWIVFTATNVVFQNNFNVLVWVLYLLPQVTTFNRWIIFMWILGLVENKFQQLNDKIRFLMQDNCGEMITDNSVSSRSMKNSNYNSILLSDKIQLIAQLHRELRTAIYRIVQHIALGVLFDILTMFLDVTITVHIIYLFLKERKQMRATDVRYLGSISFWIVVPIVLLSLMSNNCGSTIDEANKTGKILHAILNDIDNFGETKEAAKFKMFSLDLL